MSFERPPTEAELEAIGFDFDQRFGIEFEFFMGNGRSSVADEIAGVTGVRCYAEQYNHDDGNYWKIVTDGSLGSEDDDDDCEYNCDDCNVSRECDHDCAYTCPPTYYCHTCNMPMELRPQCEEDNDHDPAVCAARNDSPEYDCDDCEQDRYCDEYCSDHCEPTYSNSSGGMELVSRPLLGTKGALEVYRVLDVLNSMGPEINDRCGLHIHLDAEGMHLPEYRSLVKLYMKYERTIDEVMPHSRRVSNQCHAYSLLRGPMGYDGKVKQYFHDLNKTRSVNRLIGHHLPDRYMKLNIASRRAHGTVEFRHHSGTTRFDKTIHWLVLCQRMLAVAKTQYKVRFEKDPLDHVLPLESLMRTIKAPPQLRHYWYARHDHFAAEIEAERQVEAERMRRRILEEQNEERYRRRMNAIYLNNDAIVVDPNCVPPLPMYGSTNQVINRNRIIYQPNPDEPIFGDVDIENLTATTDYVRVTV